MTTTDPKLIDCPQISMGHGKVDVGIILHEGRKGLIFHPRESYIPVGALGELAGDYWPQPEDVVIWIDAPEGADVIVREITPLATAPTAAAINEAAHQWQDIASTEWIDGRDVVLFAHGMEVSARYCPGEWSDDTPISPREYSGAVWSCFDDQFQFEIEETSSNPAEWHHGPVTHWREPTPAIEAKESRHG